MNRHTVFCVTLLTGLLGLQGCNSKVDELEARIDACESREHHLMREMADLREKVDELDARVEDLEP
jgi:chaperonin cofactor prefoldin